MPVSDVTSEELATLVLNGLGREQATPLLD